MITSSSNGCQAFIHISNIDFGDFPSNERDSYIAYVGSRENLMQYPLYFNYRNKNKLTYNWTFDFPEIPKAYLQIALYKRRFFAPNELIGELYLRIAHFELNSVVTHSFNLKTEDKYQTPPSICLDVHVDDSGADPFYAQPGMLFRD